MVERLKLAKSERCSAAERWRQDHLTKDLSLKLLQHQITIILKCMR